MYASLTHHAAREMPKVTPTLALVSVSWFLQFPWGVVASFIACVVGLVTLAHMAWTWHREATQKPQPKPTVPPAHGP